MSNIVAFFVWGKQEKGFEVAMQRMVDGKWWKRKVQDGESWSRKQSANQGNSRISDIAIKSNGEMSKLTKKFEQEAIMLMMGS